MIVMGNRRSAMQVYSNAQARSWAGLCCHRVRLVISEKGIDSEFIEVAEGDNNEELLRLNPAGSLPTLVDRDLALFDADVIIDYLDERYPHPPLMPTDPVSRARTRLALHRIKTEWYALLPDAPSQHLTPDEAGAALAKSLTDSNDVFAAMPYFLSEEYSVLDAALAPLLFRLASYGIVLPATASAITQYSKKVISRPGFANSLSSMERDLVK